MGVIETADTKVLAVDGHAAVTATEQRAAILPADDAAITTVDAPVRLGAQPGVSLHVQETAALLQVASGVPGPAGPAGEAVLTVRRATLTFAGAGMPDRTATVTDIDCTTGHSVFAQLAPDPPAGRTSDDITVENYAVWCTPGDGEFTVLIRAIEGIVQGTYYLDYVLGER